VLVLLVMSTGFCAANTVDLYVIGSQPHVLISSGFSVSNNWTVPQANVQDGLLMTLAVGTGYTVHDKPYIINTPPLYPIVLLPHRMLIHSSIAH
jgi:hypothetical protein